jgi:hypothetical protein
VMGKATSRRRSCDPAAKRRSCRPTSNFSGEREASGTFLAGSEMHARQRNNTNSPEARSYLSFPIKSPPISRRNRRALTNAPAMC